MTDRCRIKKSNLPLRDGAEDGMKNEPLSPLFRAVVKG
jgi:hypothetical protein